VLFPVALLARVPIRRFVRAIAKPVSIAFRHNCLATVVIAREREFATETPSPVVEAALAE
jgi:hypothetical protein